MRNFFLPALMLFAGTVLAQPKKILIVSTNIDSVGVSQSGTYLIEIAYPFQQFIDAGFQVDIVTPYGGKAAIYHTGKVPEALEKIRSSALFKEKTQNTISPEDLDFHEYAGMYYPGGHGQYFDVASDERIANLAAAVHESGGVVAAAGHGMSSWIHIRLSDCRFMVEGVTMTCFPTWAEKAWMDISGYGKYLPFDMEEHLSRRSANLIVPSKDQTSDTAVTNIIDAKNRIITGTFAFNAPWVAEEMIKMIRK